MNNHLQVTEDFAELYQLAKSLGESFDLEKNTTNFLKLFTSLKKLDFSGIWIREALIGKTEDNGFCLLSHYPKSRAKMPKLDKNHPVISALINKNYVTGTRNVLPEDGQHTFFKLGDFGLMQLRTSTPIPEEELVKMEEIAQQLCHSLAQCIRFKKLEEEKEFLRQELNKFHGIYTNMYDSVFMADENGAITDFNDMALEVFNLRPENILGKNAIELLICPKYWDMVKGQIESIAKTEDNKETNFCIEICGIKEGRPFPVDLGIVIFQNREKNNYCFFFRDISDRKEVEAHLITSRKKAEKAMLAEQQFLTNMSHEIRTPMNAVIGMTHLLLESKPSPNQQELLETLKFSADSLMGIINNILDLSKIEAGELDLENHSFNLRSLIFSLQRTFQYKIKDKKVDVIADFDPRIQNLVTGDSTRLNQILTNLLDNATKFTEKGMIGITVKLADETDSDYHIEFKIHDTGIGIAKDKIPLIFENFKQMDASITRKYGGSGLGLAIVKQLVEILGGSIEVDTELRIGTTFTISLPFTNTGILAVTVEKKKETMEDPKAFFRNLRVLIVEDNLMNQRLISKLLESWECPFDLISNGGGAVKHSLQNHYDIILMDVHMPWMDGIEATKIIRWQKNNPNRETPIIALTAAALQDEQRRALDAGMNDFITKPFTPDSLKAVFKKWVKPMKRTNKIPKTKPTKPIKIDFKYLEDFSAGDKHFIAEMIHEFLNHTPIDIGRMHDAYSEDKWTDIYKIAHKLKSNYLMMGMEEQRANAEQIELMANSTEVSKIEIEPLISRLISDSEAAFPVLRKKLEEYQ